MLLNGICCDLQLFGQWNRAPAIKKEQNRCTKVNYGGINCGVSQTDLVCILVTALRLVHAMRSSLLAPKNWYLAWKVRSHIEGLKYFEALFCLNASSGKSGWAGDRKPDELGPRAPLPRGGPLRSKPNQNQADHCRVLHAAAKRQEKLTHDNKNGGIRAKTPCLLGWNIQARGKSIRSLPRTTRDSKAARKTYPW